MYNFGAHGLNNGCYSKYVDEAQLYTHGNYMMVPTMSSWCRHKFEICSHSTFLQAELSSYLASSPTLSGRLTFWALWKACCTCICLIWELHLETLEEFFQVLHISFKGSCPDSSPCKPFNDSRYEKFNRFIFVQSTCTNLYLLLISVWTSRIMWVNLHRSVCKRPSPPKFL